MTSQPLRGNAEIVSSILKDVPIYLDPYIRISLDILDALEAKDLLLQAERKRVVEEAANIAGDHCVCANIHPDDDRECHPCQIEKAIRSLIK